MAQKPAGASIPITNTNYRRNICLSEKIPFEKVAEDFSKQKLTLLNCAWEQSARIIQMSRVNERLSNTLIRDQQNIPFPKLIQIGDYWISVNKNSQPIITCHRFPFTYSFREELVIAQDIQDGKRLPVTLPYLRHTPFYFLRLLIYDETITEYGYDEYGFQKVEYLTAEKLAFKYKYTGSWGGYYQEILGDIFLTPPELFEARSEYGRLFYIYDCRGNVNCSFEMIPVGESVLVWGVPFFL